MDWKEFVKPKKYIRLVTIVLIILISVITPNVLKACGPTGICGNPFDFSERIQASLKIFVILSIIAYLPGCTISYFYSKKKQ